MRGFVHMDACAFGGQKHQVSWSQIEVVWASQVGAGIWTWILYKSPISS